MQTLLFVCYMGWWASSKRTVQYTELATHKVVDNQQKETSTV